MLGIKRRSESLIEILFSGQRGNVFLSVNPPIISIFKKGVGIKKGVSKLDQLTVPIPS